MAEIITVSGSEVDPYLADAARLRIEIFREFPYLYEGSEEYENEYLERYSHSKSSILVIALNDGAIVGVSTGLPMIEADEAFQKPFLNAGQKLEAIFYFGESVLAKSERGKGIGHRFFDEREKHARSLGYKTFAFCSVVRAPDHPLKPADYRANDLFWQKRGYQQRPDLECKLSWSQIDQTGEDVCNSLTFWFKDDSTS